jgi:hypothetical protein
MQKSSAPKKKRAQGMPDARCTRGLVRKRWKEAHTSIQVQRKQSDIPCAMVLRLIPCSPRRRIRLVTVADGLKDRPNPVGPWKTSVSLTPATGARTTRFCRTQLRRSSARCVRSRTKARPANTTTRPTLPRPPHPRPNVRDDGQRPSLETGWRELVEMICPTGEGECFWVRGWTGSITLIGLCKLVGRRRATIGGFRQDAGRR